MSFLRRLLGRRQPQPGDSREVDNQRDVLYPRGVVGADDEKIWSRTDEGAGVAGENDSEIPWSAVVSAYLETLGGDEPVGLQVLTREPPFVEYLSAAADGWPQLRDTCGERQLLAVKEAAHRAQDEVLAARLEEEIERDFPVEARSEVKAALAGYEQSEGRSARIHLAILQLSGGDLEKVSQHVAQANEDARDVMVAAWYRERTAGP